MTIRKSNQPAVIDNRRIRFGASMKLLRRG